MYYTLLLLIAVVDGFGSYSWYRIKQKQIERTSPGGKKSLELKGAKLVTVWENKTEL